MGTSAARTMTNRDAIAAAFVAGAMLVAVAIVAYGGAAPTAEMSLAEKKAALAALSHQTMQELKVIRFGADRFGDTGKESGNRGAEWNVGSFLLLARQASSIITGTMAPKRARLASSPSTNTRLALTILIILAPKGVTRQMTVKTCRLATAANALGRARSAMAFVILTYRATVPRVSTVPLALARARALAAWRRGLN